MFATPAFAQAAGAGGAAGAFTSFVPLILIFAIMYFLLIRPQQKRAKQQQEMTNSLAEGNRIMLSSGVLGTIRHLGERQAIIEIAPGVEMTVVKQAIVKTLGADDDEFEYADEQTEPAPAEPASPFDSIQPSDFNDPKPYERGTEDDSSDSSNTHK